MLGALVFIALHLMAMAYVQRPSWFANLPELTRQKRMVVGFLPGGCWMILVAATHLLTIQDHASWLRIVYFIVAVQGGAMIGFAIREFNPHFRNEREEA